MFSETAQLGIKRQESEAIRRKVAAFAESGREIAVVPVGVSGDKTSEKLARIQGRSRRRANAARTAATRG